MFQVVMEYLNNYQRYIYYGLLIVVGYVLHDLIEWAQRENVGIGKLRKIYDFVSKVIKNVYIFFNFYERRIIKLEKELFYKYYDKEVIDRHGKLLNIYDIPHDSLNKIFNTKILIIGLGGLGSPVCLYLSRFGFKEIGLVDGDKVEKSNLHRQIIHKEKNIGLNKCLSAKLFLKDIDNYISDSIKCYPFFLDKLNGMNIIKEYDIIIDCTDNISTRFLINDLCILYKKKLIFASALGIYGQVNVYNLNNNTSNCYRCLKSFNNHSQNNDCDENGILSTVTGVIGLLQANEVIKLSLGLDQDILSNFLTYNSFSNKLPFESLNINYKNKNCICSNKNFKELYNFILSYNYDNINNNNHNKTNNNVNNIYCNNLICYNKTNQSYIYQIDTFQFIDILNNNFSSLSFPVNQICILDVRKINNANIYGLKNAIKWSFYEIIEIFNKLQHNKDELLQIIMDKLNVAHSNKNILVIVVCRRGIDSLKITKQFNNLFLNNDTNQKEPTYNNNDISLYNSKNKNYDNKNLSNNKQIITYNLKGGYLQLQKKIFKNLPFF
ncbi:ubiquitin-activating enzyme [Plasmodium gaboni]|uniref:Ubiquitin-activating enzyme n=1 Tax=Plasmodium gaboni TaxID=647221 RepID=A0A151LEP5_9APIC|nr:ubiquitin-activating enzyme [Plasmodium gaboni]KYN97410.1 ubiquitin-activating enzyme [Plasmodium gaboni]